MSYVIGLPYHRRVTNINKFNICSASFEKIYQCMILLKEKRYHHKIFCDVLIPNQKCNEETQNSAQICAACSLQAHLVLIWKIFQMCIGRQNLLNFWRKINWILFVNCHFSLIKQTFEKFSVTRGKKNFTWAPFLLRSEVLIATSASGLHDNM